MLAFLKGAIHFCRAGTYHVSAGERIERHISKNARFISGGNLSIQCQDGDMHREIQHAKYLYAQDCLTIESQSIYFSAMGDIRLQVADRALFKGARLTLSSQNDSLVIRAPHVILTTKRFQWRCGQTSLSLDGSVMKIVAPSAVVDGFMTALAT